MEREQERKTDSASIRRSFHDDKHVQMSHVTLEDPWHLNHSKPYLREKEELILTYKVYSPLTRESRVYPLCSRCQSGFKRIRCRRIQKLKGIALANASLNKF